MSPFFLKGNVPKEENEWRKRRDDEEAMWRARGPGARLTMDKNAAGSTGEEAFYSAVLERPALASATLLLAKQAMIRPLSLVASTLQAACLLLAFTEKLGGGGGGSPASSYMASDHIKLFFVQRFSLIITLNSFRGVEGV